MSTPIRPPADDQPVDERRTVDAVSTHSTPSGDNGSAERSDTARLTPAHLGVGDHDSSDRARQFEGSDTHIDRATVIAQQKERFGGIKFGSAFFGWLTATGMAVILLAILTAVGVGFGLATNANIDQATQAANSATQDAKNVTLIGAIVLLVVLLLSYYCGGYVAGRMARFNGFRQGLAVWIWAIITTLVVAVIAAIAGSKYNIFSQLNLPRIPVQEGNVTTVAVIAIVAALLAALVGALLGGLAGMRFHRKVDNIDLNLEETAGNQ